MKGIQELILNLISLSLQLPKAQRGCSDILQECPKRKRQLSHSQCHTVKLCWGISTFASLLLKVELWMLGVEPGCLGSQPWLPLWTYMVSWLLSDKAGAVWSLL